MSEQLCEKLVRTLGKFYGYIETELALATPQVDLSVHRLYDFRQTAERELNSLSVSIAI